MAHFDVPKQAAISIQNIDEFLGVDFTSDPTDVDDRRSPWAPNMIRDVPGKVRKSMGYAHVTGSSAFMDNYPGRINGVFYLYNDAVPVVHAGTNIYKGSKLLYSTARNQRSNAWQFGEKLFIVDGKRYLVFDGTAVAPVDQSGYIPTVTIAATPAGGDGQHYEDFNLLSPWYRELYMGDGTTKAYQLDYYPLDAATVKVRILNSNGNWVNKTEGTDFTVNRTTGVVTFTTAPAKPPITSEDNVEITAARTVSGYAGRINKCDIGATFGVGGAADRLFLSGNPDFPNYDWYSGQNDPSYFPDLGYSLLGSASSRVMGYTVIDSYLAAHKDGRDTERNVILRQGDLADGKPAFPTVRSMQGTGAIAKHSFAYLINEPLFLTGLGVYAITPLDITGEKYSQNRSFYLNGRMLEEPNLADAFAFVYKDLYFLCVNGVAYILDGLQPFAPERNMPYSTRQYAGFYRQNLPARVMWEWEGDLYFGAPAGKVYRFHSDKQAPESFNDDGEAILARWETPDLDGKLFYKNKNFRYVAVRLMSAVATGMKLFSFTRGQWTLLKEDFVKARYLDFSRIIFSKFTFSGDFTPKVIGGKVKVKKVDKARFAFENGELNEPFGLYDMAFEYRESGNAK